MCQVDTQTELSAVLNGNYDSFAKSVCSSFISPTGTCIDVGANIGFWSCYMAKLKSTGSVFSFEPSERNFQVLSENVKRNNLAQGVRAFKCGLSNLDEHRSLYRSSDYGSLSFEAPVEPPPTNQTIEGNIELRTLDSFLLDFDTRVELIKIDVEGYEYEVLSGGTKLIRSHHPTILFEVNAHYLLAKQISISSILDVMPNAYEHFILRDSYVEPLDPNMSLQPTDLFDVIATCEPEKLQHFCKQ
jgi:FkbM family methyltransferase